MESTPNTATILYVDDDQELADFYSRALELEGYRVRRASNGEEGLTLARHECPDIILLDWMMPGKNGFETCQELRKTPSLQDVPVVLLTSFGRNIPFLHAPNGSLPDLHVQDCLEKPVDVNVLLNRLATILSGTARADSRRA
jgi:DNA-binding response OmpR family regulator